MPVLLNDAKTMASWLNQAGILTPTCLKTPSDQEHGKALHVRELDCLYFLVKGMTMKQIAAALNRAPKTIEHYLEAIKQKLNCRLRSELIAKGLTIPEIRNRI